LQIKTKKPEKWRTQLIIKKNIKVEKRFSSTKYFNWSFLWTQSSEIQTKYDENIKTYQGLKINPDKSKFYELFFSERTRLWKRLNLNLALGVIHKWRYTSFSKSFVSSFICNHVFCVLSLGFNALLEGCYINALS
jgi:hypothetical protein